MKLYCPGITSYRDVVKKLKVKGYFVSTMNVYNVVNSKGKQRKCEETGAKYKKCRPCPIVTPEVIKAIDQLTNRENVPTQSFIAQKVNVSQATVNRVIHDKLDKKTREKTKVHVLNLIEMKNRMSTCIRLYKNHLAGDKCKYVVTLDESWIHLKFQGNKTSFCYIKRGESVPEDWVKQKRTLWEEKFMVIAVMTYYGTVPLFKLPHGRTMNAEFYVNNVLKPLIHNYLLPIFAEDMNKVFLHHDKSPVHTAEMTKLYLQSMTEKFGLTFISKEDIPVKGADCAPLDFYGFGYLKRKVESSGVRTIKGSWKKCQEVWSAISPRTCASVYQSWKRRCRKIYERRGSHVEQVKEIHKRKLREHN